MKYYNKRNRLDYWKHQDNLKSILERIDFSNMSFEENKLISGAINSTWDSWNMLIRELWLMGFYENYLLHPNHSKKYKVEIALNKICAKTPNERLQDRPLVFYREPTWGDPDVIDRISSYFPQSSFAQNMSSPLSIFKNEIIDFQKIRNNTIHRSNGGIQELHDRLDKRNYHDYLNKQPIFYLKGHIGSSQLFAYQDILHAFDTYLTFVFRNNPQLSNF